MPRQFKVTVNGRDYEVAVLELTAVSQSAQSSVPAASSAAPALVVPSATPAAAESCDVLAAMGGVVVEVDVTVAQTVAVGDRLLVLEAMKMKTPVLAPRAGQVTRVLVAAGHAVEGGQPLLTLTTA